jgi:tetratricopeptide (TPR) repeat protein
MGSKAKELKHDKDATCLFDKGINILAESADHCADQRSECELLSALYFVQGDLFSADMTWRKLVNIFPNECTFYVELMELWHEFSKTADLSLEESQQKSLAWGELAASKAYGAQTLSVALKRANILVDMGKIEEAKKILVKALASVPAPDASHGKTRIEYKREQIEKLLKKLDS